MRSPLAWPGPWEAMPLDPVCGMGIAIGDGTPSVAWAGREHFFCSAACAARFRRDPAKYAGARPAPVR